MGRLTSTHLSLRRPLLVSSVKREVNSEFFKLTNVGDLYLMYINMYVYKLS